MPLPDNRLRFPAPLIDFTTEVGDTGQDHDNFPGASVQPRYDWMLMWYIALLSNQSSYEEPSEYRPGTIWFDLNTNVLKIWNGLEWASMSTTIPLVQGLDADSTTTLQEWYDEVATSLLTVAPEMTFSGISEVNNATIIPVPDSLQASISEQNSRPFVHINGLLIDPRDCEFQTTATVVLKNGVVLNEEDTFTVEIKNISPPLFYTPNVRVTS